MRKLRVLIMDTYGESVLDWALRCRDDGHEVKWYFNNPQTDNVGRGLIERVPDWRGWMRWADIVLMTDNTKHLRDLDGWRKEGVKIIGPSQEGASWELDRKLGMKILEKHGIECPAYKEFTDYDAAIKYVMKEDRAFVSKPCGVETDKSLSYVAKSPEDLVFMLQRWKKMGKLKGSFILQEKVDGIEMGVGGWFGPGGFNEGWEENYEHKALMPGNIGPNCYSADTEALTAQGWRHFSDIKATDLVASYNPQTSEIFYESPVALHWRPYEGEMIHFKNRYADLLVTPTHQMWMARRKKSDFRFYDAAHAPGESVILQHGTWHGTRLETFYLPASIDGRRKRNAPVPIDGDLWCQFLGFYLSEGSVGPNHVKIAQLPGLKRDQMEAVLKRLPFSFSRGRQALKIHSTQLAAYLRPMGHSHQKRVPTEIRWATPSQINLFLDAYVLGDGDIHNGFRRVSSNSWFMISDIQELLTKLNRTGVISVDKRTTMHAPNGKTYKITHPVYSIQETDRTSVSLRKNNKRKVAYSGFIGCVTLPTTHLLIVRRNGRVAICGNTGEMGTLLTFVKKSKLADKTLKPLAGALEKMGYLGCIDVNSIIDEKGKAWPLEFTMRLGWPAFLIQQALHKGDHAEWLLDLAEGRDAKCFEYGKTAAGVVMAIPDFPYSKITRKEVTGIPLYGITDKNRDAIHPCMVMAGEAPQNVDGTIVTAPCLVTAGDYVLVATGTGKTVRQARTQVYGVLDDLKKTPGNPFWRIDIGQKLKMQLPKLQALGYAKETSY